MTPPSALASSLSSRSASRIEHCYSRTLRQFYHAHTQKQVRPSRAITRSIDDLCSLERANASSYSESQVTTRLVHRLHSTSTSTSWPDKQSGRQNYGTTSRSPSSASNRKYDCSSNLNRVSHEIADVCLHYQFRHLITSSQSVKPPQVQGHRDLVLHQTQPRRARHQLQGVLSASTSRKLFQTLPRQSWTRASSRDLTKSRGASSLAFSSIAGPPPHSGTRDQGSDDFDQSRHIRWNQRKHDTEDPMSSAKASDGEIDASAPAQHKPLVVGLKKPQAQTQTQSSTMTSADESSAATALNEEIKQNVETNTAAAAPAEEQKTKKKEKGPKQPKPPKNAAPAAPTSPALIDLRVGHILRAIAHPNADSLYVSTIAMGDPEGTEHTQVDEETGKVVRTVCSGLKAYIPLEEMQDRRIIVVANLKPVNMRSIKSAAMVLAASPKPEEGADAHAPDRVVELVVPPAGSEAGDKVYFEGWPYGEGKGPEKQLNPKKKQWEAIQPGFYTSDDLTVGFDASLTEEVDGSNKGELVVEGKGKCTVPTLKGAVVR